MKLILRVLNEKDEPAFIAGHQKLNGEDLTWYSFVWREGMPYSEMLTILRKESAGIGLAPGRVPATMLYGFVGDEIVGRVSVRHSLNDYLRHRGGHFGYWVANEFRQRGYATEMVRQTLTFCRGLGLASVLVTCSDDNAPSWKIIERFGGKLENRVWDDEDKEMIRRYWIELVERD